MKRLLIPLMLMLIISACGKTGELYLPEAEQGIVSTPVESSLINNEETSRGSL